MALAYIVWGWACIGARLMGVGVLLCVLWYVAGVANGLAGGRCGLLGLLRCVPVGLARCCFWWAKGAGCRRGLAMLG